MHATESSSSSVSQISKRAHELLCEALGPDAQFRDGQLEAITTLVHDRGRLLVVQRTGWGKSSVYFITTNLLREQGGGPTLLVSPLLALMRDQIRSAAKFGLVAASMDSTNTDDWPEITAALQNGDIDLLLVSPERLASAAFQRDVLNPMLPHIGLFVVDEAHCISDWGHDFRPDYRRIRSLLDDLDPGCAVLATTATANDAVVADVTRQLGSDVRQLRGPLSRASLRLQALHIASESDRMAWLAQHIPELPGSGIVYVLTKAHAARIAGFLASQGLRAEHYTGGGAAGGRDATRKLEIERRLLANDLDVVVATPALGMGFDKPDLGWVVHFQMPQSLVHLYQQVGRAGRAVDDAVGVLLYGDGDQRITDYFIDAALPPIEAFENVAKVLTEALPMPLSVTDIAKSSRVGRATVDRVLGQLSVETPSPVRRISGGWAATGSGVAINREHMVALTARRREEYARIQQWARGDRCLMVAIADELDDPTATECGKCAVCVGKLIVSDAIDPGMADAASAWRDAAPARRRRTRRAPTTTARTKRRRKRS